MKKKIYLSLIILIFGSFVGAQSYPYFSYEKTSGGIMIGVETINSQTKSTLKPLGYFYEWIFPEISLVRKTTATNIFFLSLERIQPLTINLKINKPLTRETYSFQAKINPTPPQVKIARQTKGLLLPLIGSLNQDDSLIIVLKNFSSKNLRYLWNFNGAFLSNEKEIPVSLLKEKSGIIEVKVFGDLKNESASDVKTIKIE